MFSKFQGEEMYVKMVPDPRSSVHIPLQQLIGFEQVRSRPSADQQSQIDESYSPVGGHYW